MRCHTVRQKLDLYASQELVSADQGPLEAHLRECPVCRESLAKLERLQTLLKAVPAPPIPEGFAERVVARARMGEPIAIAGRRGSGRFKGASWQRIGTGLATAAAIAAGLLLGTFLGRETWPAAERPAAVGPSDPLAASGFRALTGPGDDTLAQTYLELISSRDG